MDKLPVVCIPVIVGRQNKSDVADEELLEPHIKKEEGTDTSFVPAQKTNRFGCRTRTATTRYVPGVNVGISAIHNYYAALQEIDNEEVELNTELAMFYSEMANVGAGIGGGFEDTSELKPMKYAEAINSKDEAA